MKQRGFSAAGWADDAYEFSLLDFEIDVLQRGCEGAARIGIAAEYAAEGGGV
jgi:hypothetical protein